MTAEISLPTISHCNPCCNFLKAFYRVRAIKNVFLLVWRSTLENFIAGYLRCSDIVIMKINSCSILQNQTVFFFKGRKHNMRLFIFNFYIIHLAIPFAYYTAYLTTTNREETVIS